MYTYMYLYSKLGAPLTTLHHAFEKQSLTPKFEFTSPNQILEFIFIYMYIVVLNKN